MNWNDLWLRTRALFLRRRAEEELDEELNFHLEMEARQKGLPPSQAKAAFGGVEQYREQCRDVRGVSWVENLGRDIRYGFRMLRKSPAFTTVAILSLAIGIGANTAVFTLVDAVLLRTLPVRNPEQLVILRWGARKGPDINTSFSSGGGKPGTWETNVVTWRIFRAIRDDSRAFRDVFGFSQMPGLNVAVNGQALVTGGLAVTGGYFSGLGVPMAVGRPLTVDDETAAGGLAAVISYGLWERVFGLDPSVVGRSITVNAHLCTIVGVTPKGFAGVSLGGFWRAPQIDVTLPIVARQQLVPPTARPTQWFTSELYWVQTMGRLRDGVARATAEAELTSLLTANAAEETKRELAREPPHVTLLDGSQGLSLLRDTYDKPLFILSAVVGLTLLMACTNLAALLLARAATRQKEVLIRLATGATRTRLVRQLLVEGALLAVAGALAGAGLAYAGVQALLALIAAGPSPILIDVHPDLRVMGFTAAVAVVTTFLFALAPALRATRVDVAHGLKADTPATSGTRFGTIRVLVAVQIAVALLLLAGAGLFQRTLTNLRGIRLGFNPGNLVVFDVAPGANGYTPERLRPFYTQVAERLHQISGVTGVTLVGQRLVDGITSSGPIQVEGAAVRCGVFFNWVGPEFFEVLQTPVPGGRSLDNRDMTPTSPAVVVNEAAARKCFDGAALAKRFRRGNSQLEVVGVASDTVYDRLRREPPPTVFIPYPTTGGQRMTVMVRTSGRTPEAVSAIRRAIAGIDSSIPLIDLKTMESQIDDTLAQERLFASLVGMFALIALSLASVGLYGLVASSVAGRTREIGVRMALGAGRADVLRMILGQVAATAAAGVAIGLPATWALTRIVESQLFGVKAHDPVSLTLAVAGVFLMAAAAAFWPARRATRIDPLRALRYE